MWQYAVPKSVSTRASAPGAATGMLSRVALKGRSMAASVASTTSQQLADLALMVVRRRRKADRDSEDGLG